MTDSSYTGLISCVTTVATRAQADAIADELVNERFAACVQIDGPIHSVYQWKGEVNRDEEYRLTIKSTAEKWSFLCEKLQSIHPYEEPQIIRFNIDDASAGYHQWATEQCTDPS